MPGAEKDQILQAMLLADRLSINLEAPTPNTLSNLAPKKEYGQDLMRPLNWIEEIRTTQSPRNAWKGTWPSSTTQFVVGAAGETDRELLSTTNNLIKTKGISRTYFSSFNPIKNTPLENRSPSPPQREFRLYQASYLLRDYGFSPNQFDFQNGNLPLNIDPKTAWADKNLKNNPIEINTASRSRLMLIPGIGPNRANAILDLRRSSRITSFSSLKKSHLIETRSAPYILINGKSPARQIKLF
jgi:predicted DNA-binding helix-hairpin-helix protein